MEKGFTLVIPLYNKVNCVRQTLDSVLHNHGEYPFKCIIVDDDSTDGSSEIGEEYDEKYPDIFMYIKRKHHEQKTATYARNLGIELAETEYIGFLDADDELCAGFIDRGCVFLDEHPEYSAYACGEMRRYKNNNGEIYNMYYTATDGGYTTFVQYLLKDGINMHHSSNIYKTELVKKTPYPDTFNEDVVFKLKYIYYNEPIYFDKTSYESFIWNTMYGESKNFWFRNESGLGCELLS
jgi:glycosyltransferase involved in cell wall biosynthesis